MASPGRLHGQSRPNLPLSITFVIGIITNVFELHRSITNVNNFADRLRYARKLRGLSQSALAAACGLSQGAIANYESKARQQTKEIFRLATALNVEPQWLAEGIGPMEKPEAPPTPPAFHVAEAGPGSQAQLWPFPTVPASVIWSLTPRQRAIAEEMLATLVQSLQTK